MEFLRKIPYQNIKFDKILFNSDQYNQYCVNLNPIQN